MKSNNLVYIVFFLGVTLVTLVFDRAFAAIFVETGTNNQSIAGDAFLLSTALGVVLSVALAAYLYFSTTAKTFVAEAIEEIGKISWPERAETKVNTIVVVVFSVIFAGILGVLDAALDFITRQAF